MVEMVYTGAHGAILSQCRTWRYCLWRVWDDDKPFVMWIGLNPSTADETNDDPTIRRIIGFSKDWGFGGVYMTNLFAFRATQPQDLKKSGDPVGKGNLDTLMQHHLLSAQTIFAWGAHGSFLKQDEAVLDMFAGREEELDRLEIRRTRHPYWCLGLTKAGHPKHPLYLAKTTERIPYTI